MGYGPHDLPRRQHREEARMTAAQPIRHETADAETVGRKGRMDQVITPVANGFGNSVGWMAEHGVLFAIFAVMWIAFAAGLALSEGSVDQACGAGWFGIRGTAGCWSRPSRRPAARALS